MTFDTKSNNTKPMLGLIAFVVVVFLRLFCARTYQGVWTRQFMASDSIPYCKSRFYFNGMFSSVLFLSGLAFVCLLVSFFNDLPFYALLVNLGGKFACVALLIVLAGIFTFVRLAISSLARFTLVSNAVFGCISFIEIRNIFSFLAMATLFCYNWLRHGFFLFKKLCLRAVQAQYLSGSLYYTISGGGVK